MKTIYFVRHGESEINAGMLKTCIPDNEAKLTEKGKAQSRFIAERAKHLPAEVIIASPFVRTRDTAQYIVEATGLPVEYSELFTERIPPTSLAGREWALPESNAFYREWADTSFQDGARVEDGENFNDVRDRAVKALEYLEARSESSIIVVSHGFFLRMLMAVIIFGKELTPDQLRQLSGATRTTNTGITVLSNEIVHGADIDADLPRWRIVVFNDHAHLG